MTISSPRPAAVPTTTPHSPARDRRARASSFGEELFLRQLRERTSLPDPQREFRFHPERRFRFDFAWPDIRLAVEIDGGVWSAGRHVRGSGFERDCTKLNLAAIAGWAVLRFSSGLVRSGEAAQLTQLAYRARTMP